MNPLSPNERQLLKAQAHRLRPLVQLGGKGLSASVLAEVERALDAHELIKVRAADLDRNEREVALAALCEHCAAQPVQHIGRVLVLYRRAPETEAATPAAPRRAAPGGARVKSRRAAGPASGRGANRPGRARRAARPRTFRSGRGRRR